MPSRSVRLPARFAGALCAAAVLAAAPPAPAQHAGHGAGFRAPALPAPRLSGIGTSHLPITTDSERAQEFFDQGIDLLHCFWDYEAYRAFRTAIAADPEAAMPWWGLFLSLNYNQEELAAERREALAKVAELAPRASDRERRYVRALVRLNEEPGEAGRKAFVDEMEALVAAYPDDIEAKLFLAKYLLTETGGYLTAAEARGGGPRTALARVKEILRPLFASHPDHVAVNHYWVHAHEYDADPTPALAAAERLPELAPGSGHILHMPGHVYFKLGEYAKARRSFLTAYAHDRAYMERYGVSPVDHWNYVHNLDYLVANAAESGRLVEGLERAREVQALTVPRERKEAAGAGFILYGGQTSPARLHLRYGAFDRAAESLEELLGRPSFAEGRAGDYHRGMLHYARGMNLARRGEVESAVASFQELVALNRRLAAEDAELGSDWYYDASRRVLAIQELELGGTLLSVGGRHEEAIAQLARAVAEEERLGYWEPPHVARPALESLAEAQMRAQRWEDARATYRRELEVRPKSGHAWFGIANTWVSEGDEARAAEAMRRLLEVWSEADDDLPHVVSTRRWLAEHAGG